MPAIHYLALLRGINVGGNNIIKMADLKSCFEQAGYQNVSTYIQSGNVLFSSDENNVQRLTASLEKLLSSKFNYTSRVVVIAKKSLLDVIKHAPKGFGTKPETYRYDVLFIKPPLTVSEAVPQISLKEGVDTMVAGKEVLYFSRLLSKAASSRLSKIVMLPIYQNMTIRNWNTTTKLGKLMEER